MWFIALPAELFARTKSLSEDAEEVLYLPHADRPVIGEWFRLVGVRKMRVVNDSGRIISQKVKRGTRLTVVGSDDADVALRDDFGRGHFISLKRVRDCIRQWKEYCRTCDTVRDGVQLGEVFTAPNKLMVVRSALHFNVEQEVLGLGEVSLLGKLTGKGRKVDLEPDMTLKTSLDAELKVRVGPGEVFRVKEILDTYVALVRFGRLDQKGDLVPHPAREEEDICYMRGVDYMECKPSGDEYRQTLRRKSRKRDKREQELLDLLSGSSCDALGENEAPRAALPSARLLGY